MSGKFTTHQGHTQFEDELRQTITIFECTLINAFRTINLLKAKIEALEDWSMMVCLKQLGMSLDWGSSDMFKGVRLAHEVENFLWSLENYFNQGKVMDDKLKINTVVLYLSEITMLWWSRKVVDIEKDLCIINTWDHFKTKF